MTSGSRNVVSGPHGAGVTACGGARSGGKEHVVQAVKMRD